MIQPGNRIPEATLLEMQNGAPTPVALGPLLTGRKVVIFGLPGAYTPTCSNAHVPGFVQAMPEMRAKGVEEVLCVSVNDAWVMQAWGTATGGIDAGIRFLGDPESALAEALGLRFDAPATGLIRRMKRFSMLVEDGVVSAMNVETERGVCDLTGGAAMLAMV